MVGVGEKVFHTEGMVHVKMGGMGMWSVREERKIAADWDDVHAAVIRNLPFILGPRWCHLEGTKQGTDVIRNGVF